MTFQQKNSDHFKQGRFYNPGAPRQSFLQFVKWISRRKMGYWPDFVEAMHGPKPVERVFGNDLIVTFVNHSTFLLQTSGFNILSDPVWSDRVSPIPFLGPRRHRNPGIRFDDLPPIDCILISHNHYDHLDVPTLRRLAKRDSPAVFSPLGLRPLLVRAGLTDIYELDWWEERSWRGLNMHCVPAQHFSSRTPFDRNRTLWCGWVVNVEGTLLYFAGDTGFGGHFAEIGSHFKPLRLALLPVGAYEPEWFMSPVHMTPEQAIEAQRLLKAGTAIATHFGTFALADDGMVAPVERLKVALRMSSPAVKLLVLAEGEPCRVGEAKSYHSVFGSTLSPVSCVVKQRDYEDENGNRTINRRCIAVDLDEPSAQM
jgi:L-ascorbate metabolism protein UlaG (beta-lactamase superfamily)